MLHGDSGSVPDHVRLRRSLWDNGRTPRVWNADADSLDGAPQSGSADSRPLGG